MMELLYLMLNPYRNWSHHQAVAVKVNQKNLKTSRITCYSERKSNKIISQVYKEQIWSIAKSIIDNWSYRAVKMSLAVLSMAAVNWDQTLITI